MLRNAACVALLSVAIIGTADAIRSASTHLLTFLAVSAAEAATPVRYGEHRLTACDRTSGVSGPACQRRWQVASTF